MKKSISRRQLLKVLAAAAGRLGLGALTGCASSVGLAEEGLEPRGYLPLIQSTEATSTPTPTDTPTLTPTSTETMTPSTHLL